MQIELVLWILFELFINSFCFVCDLCTFLFCGFFFLLNSILYRRELGLLTGSDNGELQWLFLFVHHNCKCGNLSHFLLNQSYCISSFLCCIPEQPTTTGNSSITPSQYPHCYGFWCVYPSFIFHFFSFGGLLQLSFVDAISWSYFGSFPFSLSLYIHMQVVTRQRCLIYCVCFRKIGLSQDIILLLPLIIWVFKRHKSLKTLWLIRYICFFLLIYTSF